MLKIVERMCFPKPYIYTFRSVSLVCFVNKKGCHQFLLLMTSYMNSELNDSLNFFIYFDKAHLLFLAQELVFEVCTLSTWELAAAVDFLTIL